MTEIILLDLKGDKAWGGGGGGKQICAKENKSKKIVQRGKVKKNTFRIPQKIPTQADGRKKIRASWKSPYAWLF